jgi:hypothetical protein
MEPDKPSARAEKVRTVRRTTRGTIGLFMAIRYSCQLWRWNRCIADIREVVACGVCADLGSATRTRRCLLGAHRHLWGSMVLRDLEGCLASISRQQPGPRGTMTDVQRPTPARTAATW